MKADPRRALLRSLVRALVDKEKIETTEAKAQGMRSFAEKLITRDKGLMAIMGLWATIVIVLLYVV